MNIAIIDDLKDDRLWLSEKLNQYMKANDLFFNLSEFDNAEQFLNISYRAALISFSWIFTWIR